MIDNLSVTKVPELIKPMHLKQNKAKQKPTNDIITGCNKKYLAQKVKNIQMTPALTNQLYNQAGTLLC